MRMRRKPNLLPRLARCSERMLSAAEAPRGEWLSAFPGFDAVHAELGCGKGLFIRASAKAYPRTLFVGIERVADALVIAAERVTDSELRNVRLMLEEAACLPSVFAPGELSRLYINFCDPWPGKKRAKRRLTSDSFLALYKTVLAPGGDIRFKTDNTALFDFSLERFEALGFALSDITRDLHGEDGSIGVIMTDYETKFHSQGVKICACTATPPQE